MKRKWAAGLCALMLVGAAHGFEIKFVETKDGDRWTMDPSTLALDSKNGTVGNFVVHYSGGGQRTRHFAATGVWSCLVDQGQLVMGPVGVTGVVRPEELRTNFWTKSGRRILDSIGEQLCLVYLTKLETERGD
jgi:hypothetical protein